MSGVGDVVEVARMHLPRRSSPVHIGVCKDQQFFIDLADDKELFADSQSSLI